MTPTNRSLSLPFNGKIGISQNFGTLNSMYTKYGYAGHFGIDFLTPHKTPILAVDDGVVSRVGRTAGNGNFIELRHVWGYSLYLHFATPSPSKTNDKIKRGQQIGEAGNTGAVWPLPTSAKPLSGTHLHFSIKINGLKNPAYKDFVDPSPFLQS